MSIMEVLEKYFSYTMCHLLRLDAISATSNAIEQELNYSNALKSYADAIGEPDNIKKMLDDYLSCYRYDKKVNVTADEMLKAFCKEMFTPSLYKEVSKKPERCLRVWNNFIKQLVKDYVAYVTKHIKSMHDPTFRDRMTAGFTQITSSTRAIFARDLSNRTHKGGNSNTNTSEDRVKLASLIEENVMLKRRVMELETQLRDVEHERDLLKQEQQNHQGGALTFSAQNNVDFDIDNQFESL